MITIVPLASQFRYMGARRVLVGAVDGVSGLYLGRFSYRWSLIGMRGEEAPSVAEIYGNARALMVLSIVGSG